MSKGKYNRRRARAKERAEQKRPQPPALHRAKETEGPTEAHTRREHNANQKGGDPMSFGEQVKSIKLNDWLLVLFTAALAVAAT